MLKKIVSASLVAATLAAASLAATGPAEARYGRHGAIIGGAALGLLGGAMLGAAMAPRYYDEPDYYYAPPPRRVYVEPACYWTRQRVWDGYGYVLRRVEVCD